MPGIWVQGVVGADERGQGLGFLGPEGATNGPPPRCDGPQGCVFPNTLLSKCHETDAGGSQGDSTASNISPNPTSLLGPVSLATQEAFLMRHLQGAPPPPSALTDTWHSVLFPQQAPKLLDKSGWTRFYTFPTSPTQVRNFRKHGD